MVNDFSKLLVGASGAEMARTRAMCCLDWRRVPGVRDGGAVQVLVHQAPRTAKGAPACARQTVRKWPTRE